MTVLAVIRNAADRYDNDKFRYIASRGAQGRWNRSAYSVVMPWSGQAIFRSGFGAQDDWSYFEIGPWGIAHQHYDKLHLSVVVGGRDILVDAGRYTYIGYHDTTNPWRNYFTGSESHNVVLIDGLGQSARQREVSSPLSSSDYTVSQEYSFARGTFDSGFKGVKNKDADKFKGKAEHTRNVLYVPQLGWIVIDTIDTDRARKIEALWRFHPDCTVQTQNNFVFTNDAGQGNLLIKPAGEYNLELNLVKGQEQPSVQGWYSEKFNVKVPNTVAVYNCDIEQSSTFVWLLISQDGEFDDISVESDYTFERRREIVALNVSFQGNRLRAIVPIRSGTPRVVFNKGN